MSNNIKRVLCPGEALIDWVAVETKPLSLCESFLKKAGGAPLNAAGAMQKFGVESYFMGAVGSDPFGEFLIQTMNDYHINTEYVSQINEFTTSAYVSLSEDGERDFIFNRGADMLLEIPKDFNIKKFDAVHFSSATAFLGGQLESAYNQLLSLAKENQIIITFDPNYRDALFADKKNIFVEKSLEFISQSDIVKLSEEEALLISERTNYLDAGKFISQLGCKYLLITLGGEGTCLFTPKAYYHLKSIQVNPVDTTGAGDAFIGSLIGLFLKRVITSDEQMQEIVTIANTVGAITTENYGGFDSIPTLEEVVEIR
ncbi:carbohydrate kinase [Mollicutes bacterium LVI A0039]|nr:carbohydrate kinase [Mollicutes bacterium LVI A0039]